MTHDEQVPFSVADLGGEIVRTGFCPRSMLSIQARDGEQLVEGCGDAVADYVFDGGLRSFTPAQQERRVRRPAHHRWDMAQMDWVHLRSLDEDLREVKALRRALCIAAIEQAEVQQHRPLREALLALQLGGTAPAATERLIAVEATIARSRAALGAIAGAGDMAELDAAWPLGSESVANPQTR